MCKKQQCFFPVKHRLCRKSVCGGAPESLCVEGSLTSAMTLVKKNTQSYAV